MNQMNEQNFAEGSTVYDVNGDKVGTLSSYDPQAGYLVAQKGLLFPHDVYIPVSAVTNSDADSIYLGLSKADLNDERYKTAPVVSSERATSASATSQTARLDQDVESVTNSRGGMAASEQAAPVAPAPSTRSRAPRGTIEDANDITVPVREEELRVQKRQAEVGHVHIHTDVVQEPETLNVPVTHEEVRVERVPVEGAAAANVAPDAFTDKEVDVPLMAEQVNVEKVARVDEEIHLHKQQVTEQQHVSDTVRKERVEVEELDEHGNVLPEQGASRPTNLP